MRNRRSGVLFQPAVGRALQRGAATMVAAVRSTLGPRPRYTALQRATGGPEILDQAGIIGRRIVALPDPDENVGAMLVRHLMWRMTEQVGDGAATAALLFQAIYDGGRTYIAAGGNPMILRRHLDAATQVALSELKGLVRPVEGREALTCLAHAVCFDAPLAEVLVEIFDIIGEYGVLDIRTGRGRNLEREYVEGMYWGGALLSRELATDAARLRGELEDARILVSNLEITGAPDLVDFLSRCTASGIKTLFLVARSISTEAMSVLVINNNAQKMKVLAARCPLAGATLRDDLEDMAILTGTKAFYQDAGESIRTVRPDDLGCARRAWVDKDYLGVSGGGGDPRAVRSHLANLRAAYATSQRDSEARQNLRRRIGKLLGGSATLWIGAATETEMEPRKALAERTAESLRAALIEGALPGGGAAFLACRGALAACQIAATTADEKAAYRILARALETPARTIIANAGAEVAAAMAEIDAAAPGYGYEVERGRVLDMAAAGILDVAVVSRTALTSAVSAAVMALTTEALVHTDFDAQAANFTP
ncbi:MAG: chaperonin GroEL [Nitrososphaerales archaeon]